MTNVCLCVSEFLNTSFSPVVGTGPRTRTACGSSERTYLPSRYASSHAIIGDSIAYSDPAPFSLTTACSPCAAASIAVGTFVSTCVPTCVLRSCRNRFSSSTILYEYRVSSLIHHWFTSALYRG